MNQEKSCFRVTHIFSKNRVAHLGKGCPLYIEAVIKASVPQVIFAPVRKIYGAFSEEVYNARSLK